MRVYKNYKLDEICRKNRDKRDSIREYYRDKLDTILFIF